MRSLIVLISALLLVSVPAEAKRNLTVSRDVRKAERPSLTLGDFAVPGPACVLDGDTIRVPSLGGTLRFLSVDTEETFKKKKEKQQFRMGWQRYVAAQNKEGSTKPVKYATPLGEDAKDWLKALFEGVNFVRLERDDPKEIHDAYGRYLTYIFIKKGDKWLNVNLELVRLGWSPYFTKYGRSNRFHEAFVKAEAEAKAAKLNIWDPKKQHYPDYPLRQRWWKLRGDAIHQFDLRAKVDPSYITLDRNDSLDEIEKREGQIVNVMGFAASVRAGERGPSIIRLSRGRSSPLSIVIFDKGVFNSAGLLDTEPGELISVRGKVSKWFDRRRGIEQLQLVVTLPSQVQRPEAAIRREFAGQKRPLHRSPKKKNASEAAFQEAR